MSIRNLDALFSPRVIAAVGASNRPKSVGAVLADNLFSAGFAGPILTVNPSEEAVRSTLNYRTVAELPLQPDLAVLATPPATVPALISELGQKGCRAAVVLTAGFGEGDNVAGHHLREEILAAAQPHLLRIVGPNCLGFLSPSARINASFAQLMPPAGSVALVSQSGAVAAALIDWAAARAIGFSHVVSVGDMADVDFGDLLDYLALDLATRAIVLYVEAITHPRKFMSAARNAARAKPVIVVKSGRSPTGAKAARSHTGALAGSDLVYDAAFRRAGLLRVTTLREVFEAVTTLASGVRIAGDRLAVLTNGGGLGVIATDALEERHGRLAEISRDTIAALDAVLPRTWSRGNPVDIIGDADPARYTKALAALSSDNGCDAILVINCPTAVADSVEAARAVADAGEMSAMPKLACWVGDATGVAARRLFATRNIPSYDTPDEAVRAFMHLVEFHRNQEQLLETPPASIPMGQTDRLGARQMVDRALDTGRTVLNAVETKTLLAAYGVPVALSRVARTPSEAGEIAAGIGKAVALKILSPDISHKSDVGGVHLDVEPSDVERAAREMERTVRGRAPDAELTGFTVEPMVETRTAEELLLGIASDETFGPIILFGHGGTAAEAIADRAIGLPPLNVALAQHMMERTRVYRLLQGYRDHAPAAIDQIARTIVCLSEIAADLPEIVELDINPLLAGSRSVLALDARAVISRAAPGALANRMAISPYPGRIAHLAELPGGQHIFVRPIRPQDEPALADMVAQSTVEDIRLRFFEQLKELPHALAARLSQIDYDREMALVATRGAEEAEILGVARLAADPNGMRAEYAVMVRSDCKGEGIGFRLMTDLLDYARTKGIRTVFGEVLRENSPMLQMARELGFALKPDPDPAVIVVSIELGE